MNQVDEQAMDIMRSSTPLIAILALSSTGCDFETLSTRPGKHVTYHWDPDEHRLCGGTLVYADRLAETMANHYGMPLDDDAGPIVEYFWSVGDVGALACGARDACVFPTPTTRNRWLSSLYSETPIHGHELAHAVVGYTDHAFPVFVNEGMAVRWQSSVLGEYIPSTKPLMLDEAQLRAEIDKLADLDSYEDYDAAFVWFAVLEVTFGPEKMGDFLRSLDFTSSSDEVDEALQRTMGISLAVSVQLAASSWPLTFDDPVCHMEGVPTFEWNGSPIVVDRRDARCTDEDVINTHSRVKSIFILDFPNHPNPVNVTVTGTSDVLYFHLQRCFGDFYWGDGQHFDGASVNKPTEEIDLRGRWVGSLLGDIDENGNVLLPRVELAPVKHDATPTPAASATTAASTKSGWLISSIGRIRRQLVRFSAPLTAVLALSSTGCDFETLSTRPGKHVTYHWDPDERQLCGGTLVYADRLAETMASHYGMPLDDDAAPFVEYFWSVGDAASFACPGGYACARWTPTTRNRWLSSIYTEEPILGHELAHAVVGSSHLAFPPFLNEGMAVRWQSSVLGEDIPITTPLLLDEAQLRAEIEKLSPLDSYEDYNAAFVWFAALEVTFGPDKMSEFLRSLDYLSSSDEVDEALRRTMGISLAVSVKLAAGYWPLTFDDPVCHMKGVPTFEWDGGPIVVDRRDARCADDDVVNWDPRIKSIFILDFPDRPNPVNVTVTGASDLLSISLQRCYGDVHWGGGQHLASAFANKPTEEIDLRGRWVGSLLGDIDDDGNVLLPRAEFVPVKHDALPPPTASMAKTPPGK